MTSNSYEIIENEILNRLVVNFWCLIHVNKSYSEKLVLSLKMVPVLLDYSLIESFLYPIFTSIY